VVDEVLIVLEVECRHKGDICAGLIDHLLFVPALLELFLQELLFLTGGSLLV
jgi:hypothetical protein